MSILKTLAVLVGCAGVGLAQAAEFADLDRNQDGVITMQEALDRDGDGVVSLEETQGHRDLFRAWRRADRDRDELLERSEFGAFSTDALR